MRILAVKKHIVGQYAVKFDVFEIHGFLPFGKHFAHVIVEQFFRPANAGYFAEIMREVTFIEDRCAGQINFFFRVIL